MVSMEQSDPDDNHGFSFSAQEQAPLLTRTFTTGLSGPRTPTGAMAAAKATACSPTAGHSRTTTAATATTTGGPSAASSTCSTRSVGLLQTL